MARWDDEKRLVISRQSEEFKRGFYLGYNRGRAAQLKRDLQSLEGLDRMNKRGWEVADKWRKLAQKNVAQEGRDGD